MFQFDFHDEIWRNCHTSIRRLRHVYPERNSLGKLYPCMFENNDCLCFHLNGKYRRVYFEIHCESWLKIPSAKSNGTWYTIFWIHFSSSIIWVWNGEFFKLFFCLIWGGKITFKEFILNCDFLDRNLQNLQHRMCDISYVNKKHQKYVKLRIKLQSEKSDLGFKQLCHFNFLDFTRKILQETVFDLRKWVANICFHEWILQRCRLIFAFWKTSILNRFYKLNARKFVDADICA